MSIFIQDGRRPSHRLWGLKAVRAGVASGVIISPFHTPRVQRPRNPAASTVVEEIKAAGGEVLFDATTHAKLLPGSNDLVHYDTWQLWGPNGVGLDTETRRYEHLQLVFARQNELLTPTLAPTLALDNPLGQAAQTAFDTAQLARGIDPACWQSLAGRRSFWRAGADLDAYVGQLASLRAPCWALTVVNDVVVDGAPNLNDHQAFAGLLRTVHSLSLRSRVIICHADYAGVPAIAAGATDLGTGWDRGLRHFDPRSFQLKTPTVLTPASYVTQGKLAAVLRRDTGEAITRVLGATAAEILRGGPMPADDAAERHHHLKQLGDLVNLVSAGGPNKIARVADLREFYEHAQSEFSALTSTLPAKTLAPSVPERWVDEPLAALKLYAVGESLW